MESITSNNSKNPNFAVTPSVQTNILTSNPRPKNIMNIGLNCKSHGVSKVYISSMLVKKNPKLNLVIRTVNDQLRELCEMNGFLFINNDMTTTYHLWRDGIHLQDIGTNILFRNFYQVLNKFLFKDHS